MLGTTVTYNAICRTCTAALECLYILELDAGSHVRTHVTERRHVVCKLERPSFKWLNGSGCSVAADDGNGDDLDACRNDCTVAACGDGVRRQDVAEGQVGYEACDDGNRVDTDSCLNQCIVGRCGDGIRRNDLQAHHPNFEEEF